LGFLVNPVAGLGGALALKGSDDVADEALRRGALPQAGNRARAVLEALLPWRDRVHVYAAAGEMGGDMAHELDFATEIVHQPEIPSSAKDTEATVLALRERQVDIVLFAGGDGTARDICRVLQLDVPVLGIPAGVKMQSGVFAVTPRAAAEVLRLMLEGGAVPVETAEVRDIDEAALRQGHIQSRSFGLMRVPQERRFLQAMKSGTEPDSHSQQALAWLDIAAHVTENMQPGVTYFDGPGRTTAAVMEALHLPNTLLGVDVVRDGQLLAADADAVRLEAFTREGECRLILTATGGQGILLGRGNQQITPVVLKAVKKQGLIVIASVEKLAALNKRPLLMDVPDAEVEAMFSGFVEVVTGYQQSVLYPLAAEG
jgi:predicted polyphosphate/ATP-dependent NAD kinase